MSMKSLLARNRHDLALVIGNGINHYNSSSSKNSWEDLLQQLSKKYFAKNRKIPGGIALTEFYDLLELKSGPRVPENNLQKDFCDLMSGWTAGPHHKEITAWANRNAAPILTTNFENVLGEATDCRLLRTTENRKQFTDFYPWISYYGRERFTNPCEGFGIWHINGMEHYHRSIRLGLTHYMGSVQRARTWLHSDKEESLFSGKNSQAWRGRSTWLHIIFNKSLLIFGLGLQENEVFLRWLLIERAKYFRKFEHRKKNAWYVHTGDPDGSGKLFFLEGVGVKPVQATDFEEIYGTSTWN